MLRRLAQGGSIYKVWIDEDDLLKAMDSELDSMVASAYSPV